MKKTNRKQRKEKTDIQESREHNKRVVERLKEFLSDPDENHTIHDVKDFMLQEKLYSPSVLDDLVNKALINAARDILHLKEKGLRPFANYEHWNPITGEMDRCWKPWEAMSREQRVDAISYLYKKGRKQIQIAWTALKYCNGLQRQENDDQITKQEVKEY